MKKVIRFTASWCKPCEALKEILTFVETTVPIEVVDIDENSEIAIEYGVRSIPAIKTFDGSELRETSVGVVSEDRIKELVGSLVL